MKATEEALIVLAKAWNTAWNTRDLETVMAFYADDVVAKVGSSLTLGYSDLTFNKQQIQSLVGKQLQGFHMDTWDYRVSGDRVMTRFEYSCDFFREEGVEALEGEQEIIFEGDKIKFWNVTHSPETIQKLWRVME